MTKQITQDVDELSCGNLHNMCFYYRIYFGESILLEMLQASEVIKIFNKAVINWKMRKTQLIYLY